ncbi:hypothetical protein DWW00_14410 [Bacteroides fragilis]|nr:hypothetical protein DWW00_14410 [Bacteroides fragilis]
MIYFFLLINRNGAMFVYFRNMHVRTYANIVFKPLARIHCGSAQSDTFQLRIRVKRFFPNG